MVIHVVIKKFRATIPVSWPSVVKDFKASDEETAKREVRLARKKLTGQLTNYSVTFKGYDQSTGEGVYQDVPLIGEV